MGTTISGAGKAYAHLTLYAASASEIRPLISGIERQSDRSRRIFGLEARFQGVTRLTVETAGKYSQFGNVTETTHSKPSLPYLPREP